MFIPQIYLFFFQASHLGGSISEVAQIPKVAGFLSAFAGVGRGLTLEYKF